VNRRHAASPQIAQGPDGSRRKLALDPIGATTMWCVGRCPHRQRARKAGAELGSGAARDAMRGREERQATKGCRRRRR
jgi:hypothetical protein